jgi:hypothetical protein
MHPNIATVVVRETYDLDFTYNIHTLLGNISKFKRISTKSKFSTSPF